MELLQTEEFERDIRKLDYALKSRLRKTLEKIIANPEVGKPLKHMHFFFSERVENYRLIYRYQQNQILLICFKNREQVYGYLQNIKTR